MIGNILIGKEISDRTGINTFQSGLAAGKNCIFHNENIF
jgi:hypothetical protein